MIKLIKITANFLFLFTKMQLLAYKQLSELRKICMLPMPNVWESILAFEVETLVTLQQNKHIVVTVSFF